MRSSVLLRINPTRSEGLDGDGWEALLADIRGHIHEFGDFKKLAELTGLSVVTISNLACAETKSPHLRTIHKVMTALGRAEALRQSLKSERPITVTEARLRTPIRKKLAERRKSKTTTKVFVRASKRRG